MSIAHEQTLIAVMKPRLCAVFVDTVGARGGEALSR